jgi:hypothetical protein
MATGVLPPLSSASWANFLVLTKRLTLRPDNTGRFPQYVHNMTKVHNVPLLNFADLSDLVKLPPKTVLASEVPASEVEHYERFGKGWKLLQLIHTVDSLYDKLMQQKHGVSPCSRRFCIRVAWHISQMCWMPFAMSRVRLLNVYCRS